MIYANAFLVSFIISLFIAKALYKVRRSNLGMLLAILTLLTSFWLLMEGISFYSSNSRAIVLFQLHKYISIAFIPPILILISYSLIGNLDKKSIFKFSPLFIIPIITCISVLSLGFPYKFISTPQVIFSGDLVIFTYERNIGFYIHMFSSYALLFSNIIILFYRAVTSPKIYRIQSIFVFGGTFFSMLLNIFFLSEIFADMVIDTTPISILATLLIYYWGVYTLPKKEIVPYARNLVIESMSDAFIIVDNYGGIIDVNPAARRLLSLSTSNTTNRNEKQIDYRGMQLSKIVKRLPITNEKPISECLKNHESIDFLIKGEILHAHVNIEAITDVDDKEIGTLYVLYDITDIQNNLNEMVRLNKDLNISDTVINEAQEGIVITNRDNTIIRVNKSMVYMTGYSSAELIGATPSLLKSDHHGSGFYKDMWQDLMKNGLWEGEIWDRRKNGNVYPKWMSITVLRDEEMDITHFIGISSDISKIKKAEKDIHAMAYYDKLTGLPNRTLFNDRMDIALQRSTRHNRKTAFLYMDLGRFKSVNDTFGIRVGDELLIAVSNRIKGRLRKSDVFCRLGGDEFVLIIEELKSVDEAGKVAQLIIDEIEKGFSIQDHDLTIHISIGIAVSPDDDTSTEGLLRKSDIAMTHAKNMGGSYYVFSSTELERQHRESNQLEIKLKLATQNKEFQLYLQPQIANNNGRLELTGAEALIRWPQADGTMIPPFKFIGIAEKNGLINPIGLWVLEEVFRINETLTKELISIDLALNVSIRQFETDTFYLRLKALIENRDRNHISLAVEITESLFFNDVNKGIEVLNQIKALGVKIALDDFGTGFSSMSYLNRLPVDYLKIDKSFIDQIQPDSNKNLAYLILSMARSLELKTIAEGIEEKEQSDNLFNAGCDLIQGYYYSRPLSVEDFIVFAKTFSSKH